MKKALVLNEGEAQSSTSRINQEFSIGIFIGKSNTDFLCPENIDNPVLTIRDISDRKADLIADPFMLSVENCWFMFFEVLNMQRRMGEIGLATSRDGISWSYQQIVLSEPFHLSYPYVFEWMDDYYMIPETFQAGSVRLYKALKFPTQWSYIGDVLHGPYYVDSSIVRFDNKWWLFTETNPEIKHDTLRLYYSDDLMGQWHEHPESPVIKGNGHIARPAGRVVVNHERVFRYSQDCDPIYGYQVNVFEITDLTKTKYNERAVLNNPVLKASGKGWNASGMHHIDPHRMTDGRWIACVDGWVDTSQD